VTFLGADTPLDTVEACVRDLQPTLVILVTYDAARFDQHVADIAALTAITPVAVVAPVAEETVSETGARILPGDIAEAAASLTT
jgi:hypothetical protein